MIDIESAVQHARDEFPRESCGFILRDGTYQRCRNISHKPESTFAISPAEYAQHDVRAVVHSHPHGTAALSITDRAAHRASGKEWIVIGLAGDDVTTASYPAIKGALPLEGRSFVFGVTDCYTLVRDYYEQELGIELPDFYREDEFWKRGHAIYDDNYAEAGFYKAVGAPVVGDLLVLRIGAPKPNHGAIYLGNGMILHHLHGRLSGKDLYSDYFRKNTIYVLRHKDARNQATGSAG
ncbi:C40 family peptidase [Pseudescherichia vulneris]